MTWRRGITNLGSNRPMDRHHVLFNKREWESRPQYKELRQNPGLIVPMDRDIHNELHRSLAHVPVLGYHAIMAVNKEFYRGRTHLETLDNLMFAIESLENHPRLPDLDKSLANIALQSLDIQKPFIIEGEIKS